MNRRLAAAAVAIAICLPLAAKPPKPDVYVVTTERAEFAPGGAIQVSGSVGELNIEGWDRAEVEITVTRSTFRPDTPRERDLARRRLNAIQVSVDRKSPAELAIRTTFPKRGFWAHAAHCRPGIQMDYRIRVPRDTRLAIRHSGGDVVVYDVSGAIEASVRAGDIEMQLPAAGQYSLDAHCRLGGVYSEFPLQTGPAPAIRVYLRVGIGGITIQKMERHRSFPTISQPSQPRVSSICWLGGGISGGVKVPWERILRIPSASA